MRIAAVVMGVDNNDSKPPKALADQAVCQLRHPGQGHKSRRLHLMQSLAPFLYDRKNSSCWILCIFYSLYTFRSVEGSSVSGDSGEPARGPIVAPLS